MSCPPLIHPTNAVSSERQLPIEENVELATPILSSFSQKWLDGINGISHWKNQRI